MVEYLVVSDGADSGSSVVHLHGWAALPMSARTHTHAQGRPSSFLTAVDSMCDLALHTGLPLCSSVWILPYLLWLSPYCFGSVA